MLYGPEDRRDAVHLGASARYRNLDNDTFDNQARYRQRPFFHCTGTHRVDTGVLDDSEGDVWAGAEFAWTSGPFTLQSEIANTALQRKDGEDDANNLWGAYLGARSSGAARWRPRRRGAGRARRLPRSEQRGREGRRADQLHWRRELVPERLCPFLLDGAITQVFNAGDSAAAVDGSSNLIYGAGRRAQVGW